MKPLIVIESHIPYIDGVFEPCADVRYLAPEEISPAAVKDADALVVRTRTRCDSALLDGSRCRVIATATIGTDHIDMDYCRRRGIVVANAPGCNAPAVAQYVFASLAGLCRSGVLGVVGVGHVGSIVAAWGRDLGFEVLVNDPPRQAAGDGGEFHTLDHIASCADVVTFHTPLIRGGAWPSYHLAGEEFFAHLCRRPVIVNAARGAVVDTGALLGAMDAGRVGHAVIDCWEGEPELSASLLERASVATPHIAGYSVEGKRRATAAAAAAVARVLGLEVEIAGVGMPSIDGAVTWDAITASYDPMTDTRLLRESPGCFEQLRNGYALRHEVGYSSSNRE